LQKIMYKKDITKERRKILAMAHNILFTKLFLAFFDLVANKKNLFHPDVFQGIFFAENETFAARFYQKISNNSKKSCAAH
jgi:hypothetical protein